jgi:DNA-binding response OmpR family regulator
MKKILVIEDNPLEVKIYTRYLSKHGYQVFSAMNGTTGIQAAKEVKPDVIICDKMMPFMDGFEVIKALRNDPVTAMTPFIFCSAVADRDNMKIGMNLGADDYICKPFDFDDVVNSIEAQFLNDGKRKHSLNARMGFNELNIPVVKN